MHNRRPVRALPLSRISFPTGSDNFSGDGGAPLASREAAQDASNLRLAPNIGDGYFDGTVRPETLNPQDILGNLGPFNDVRGKLDYSFENRMTSAVQGDVVPSISVAELGRPEDLSVQFRAPNVIEMPLSHLLTKPTPSAESWKLAGLVFVFLIWITTASTLLFLYMDRYLFG